MKFFRIFLFFLFLFVFLKNFPGAFGKKEGKKEKSNFGFVTIKETGEKVKIPPPLRSSIPVNVNFPRTFPEWFREKVLYEKEKFKKRDEELANQRRRGRNKKKIPTNFERRFKKKRVNKQRRNKIKIDFSGLNERKTISEMQDLESSILKNYVLQRKIRESGKILFKKEEFTKKGFLFPNQVVVIKTKGNQFFRIDDRLNIYRSIKKGFLFNSYYIIQILGTVRIMNPIKGGKFEAVVEKLFSTAFVGDKITSEPLIQVSFKSYGSVQVLDRSAKIIQSVDGGGLFLHPQSVVFLNRGIKHGLSENQKLAIHSNPAVRDVEILKNEKSLVGFLKIIHLQNKFSTAVITNAKEIIYVGDYVGGDPGAQTALRESASQRAINRFNNLERKRGTKQEGGEREGGLNEDEDLDFEDFGDTEDVESVLEEDSALLDEETFKEEEGLEGELEEDVISLD